MKRIGIWIDAREALVATFEDNRITYKCIYSGIDKKPRFSGETSRKTRRQLGFDYESAQQAHYNQEMKRYLQTVANSLSHTTGILYLTGPGQVRIALEKELLKNRGLRVLRNDPLDDVSVNQKLERFRKFFEQMKD